MKNVLIACEESQRITLEFRKRGVRAFSCDIKECSGGFPEYHIKGDCLKFINGNCCINTMNGDSYHIEKWDLLIAHPPCTYLSKAGNNYFLIEKYGNKAIERYKERIKAIEFFMEFVYCDCEKVAIENPVGIMSSFYRKPTQIIQPYYFGDGVSKATCLWLKNLPCLFPEKIVKHESNVLKIFDDDGKMIKYDDSRIKTFRSKTFPGVAAAIVNQWINFI